MTLNYIKQIMEQSECFNGFKILMDYLSETEKSISIVPKNSFRCIKTYSDGEKIMGCEFSIIIRLTTNNEDKSENYNLLDNVCEWLYNFSPSSTIYNLSDKNIPLKIDILSGPVLDSDNIHSGRYKIDCRFEYLLKNIL